MPRSPYELKRDKMGGAELSNMPDELGLVKELEAAEMRRASRFAASTYLIKVGDEVATPEATVEVRAALLEDLRALGLVGDPFVVPRTVTKRPTKPIDPDWPVHVNWVPEQRKGDEDATG